MVGVFAKSPSGRSAPRRSKTFLEETRGGSKSRISPAAGVQGEKPCDSFQPVEVPEEPVEHDQPKQCPRPEPSIMEDGTLWRARIVESLRRRNETLAASKAREREGVVRGGSIPSARRSRSRSLGPPFLLVAHSAPEFDVQNLLPQE